MNMQNLLKRLRKGMAICHLDPFSWNWMCNAWEGVEGVGCRVVKTQSGNGCMIVVDGQTSDLPFPDGATPPFFSLNPMPFDVRTTPNSTAGYDVEVYLPDSGIGLVYLNDQNVVRSATLPSGYGWVLAFEGQTSALNLDVYFFEDPDSTAVNTGAWLNGNSDTRWGINEPDGPALFARRIATITSAGVVSQLWRGMIRVLFTTTDTEATPSNVEDAMLESIERTATGFQLKGFDDGCPNISAANLGSLLADPVTYENDIMFPVREHQYKFVDSEFIYVGWRIIYIKLPDLATALAGAMKVTVDGTDYDVTLK